MTVRGSRSDAIVDALLVQPEVEHVVLSNDSNATALLRSFARNTESVVISLPVGRTAQVESYDDDRPPRTADARTGRPRGRQGPRWRVRRRAQLMTRRPLRR